MKGKLVKEYEDFYLISDKEIEKGDEYVKLNNRPRTLLLGTTISHVTKVFKLSKQNCDEIFGVVDVEKLAKEETRKYLPGCPENIMNFIAHERFFKIAFEQAMELYQPKEIEVEIVMDKIPADLAPGGWDEFPKLDSQGCLILKKVL